ncbi:putative Ulp1 protease family catalytic domain, papain-like cysteine peptidase superfamily [Helianthus annuus]|nr:putative Ulp1 protease family catalytic domain, papain-like cysteine peptidase superfamily [Helianthus annuus]
MGKFVTQHQYFYLPNTVKYYMDTEKKKYDKRLNKVEDELEKLKRGVNNVSEAGSCQWGNEDFEDIPDEEPLDMLCFLAVDNASNIVAKGTILMDTNEEGLLQVVLEICLHREALLPFPIKEEFIIEVGDAVGHVLSWPRHLVIRCSDLEKMVAKPKTKPVKDLECKKQIKQPKGTDEENEREFEQKIVQVEKVTGKEVVSEKEKKGKRELELQKEKEDVEVNEGKRRMTRAQRRPRIRVENNAVLTMTASVVDAQVFKADSIRLQCVDDLFGYESFTYLNRKDFEAVFTLDELTGSVITTYMMLLYEQIKNGPKHDHGICFVSPSAMSPSERKSKPKHIDDASRMVADRLSTRKDNDIILVPYNPGRHWVLAVLDMKTNTCYYLDSLRNSIINPVLRQIIDAAMALYVVQGGTKTKVKVNWVNAKTGCTECGYYVLKYMKEVVEEGIEILANDNVGRGKAVYTDEDIDGIREGCLSYGAAFVFK